MIKAFIQIEREIEREIVALTRTREAVCSNFLVSMQALRIEQGRKLVRVDALSSSYYYIYLHCFAMAEQVLEERKKDKRKNATGKVCR